jgi:hypothetical protein
MPQITLPRRLFRLFPLALVVCLGLRLPGRAPADTILYTASTDNSGLGTDPSVPAFNNPFLPAIAPGVTISPNPAFLDGNLAGPLNGITYGPFAFGANAGGTTGFVHVSFTLPAGGTFRLVWEVSDVIDHSRPSALAIDNVRLGSTLLYGFETGIPAGFTALGTVGTSGAVTDLSPTQGNFFAFLDTTGNTKPIYDTEDGTFGSRLLSSPFTATGGSTLSLDLAFLTNDGGPFHDYGIAALQQLPEPSSLISVLSATVCLAGYGSLLLRRRRNREKRARNGQSWS